MVSESSKLLTLIKKLLLIIMGVGAFLIFFLIFPGQYSWGAYVPQLCFISWGVHCILAFFTNDKIYVGYITIDNESPVFKRLLGMLAGVVFLTLSLIDLVGKYT